MYNLQENSEVLVADCIQTLRKKHKIKKSEYLSSGTIPVIDQSQGFIAGYINDTKRTYDGQLPIIVFGDHTCTLKYVDFPFAVGADGTQLIRPTKDFDTRYLYYALQDLPLEHFGYQRHFKYLKTSKILCPPMLIQHKIAAVLSAYDDLIENNIRRIKILEDMAQTLYREWFVHFRFPGHEDVPMVESPLGPIPQGWQIKKLSDLVETQYGYTESATEDEVGPKFVRGKDINKTSYIDWNTVPFCPIESAKHATYKLTVGDILVIRMADPGKVAIIEKEVEAVFASYLIRLKLQSNLLSPYYLFSTLSDESYQNYVYGVSTGTTRKSASAGVITGFDLIIPAKDVRNRFEEVIISLRKTLNNLLEKNVKLRQMRDLLLPKLISGEIDVSELDIDANGTQPTKGGTHIPYPLTKRLHSDEKILGGKPVIKGTRVAVNFILDLLKQGWSEKDVVENYPSVAYEDIAACRAYQEKVTRAFIS